MSKQSYSVHKALLVKMKLLRVSEVEPQKKVAQSDQPPLLVSVAGLRLS